ncbi:MAG: hypothetical protein ACRD1M_06780 [Terriglobales bacterium]
MRDVLTAAAAKLDSAAMLTLPEAAALLGVAVKTVESWRYGQARGRPAPALEFRRYGGAVRVTPQSVRALREGRGPRLEAVDAVRGKLRS